MSTRSSSSTGETVKVGGAILFLWATVGFGTLFLYRAPPTVLLAGGSPDPGMLLTLVYFIILLYGAFLFAGISIALLLFISVVLAEYYSIIRRGDTA